MAESPASPPSPDSPGPKPGGGGAGAGADTEVVVGVLEGAGGSCLGCGSLLFFITRCT